MTRFDQRLADHSVRETLTSLRVGVADLDDGVVEQVEQAHPGILDRASAAVDYVEGLLESADGRLVAQATLDGLNGHAEQAAQAVTNLDADPVTYAANLDQAIESAIQAAAALAPASASFAEAAQKIGRRSGGFQRKLRELEGDAEAMAAELRELDEKAGSGLRDLTAEQQQRREELTTALDAVKEAIDAQQQRIDALATDFETRFTNAEGERKESFDELVGELRETSEQTADKLTSDAESTQKALTVRGEASLGEVEQIRDRVKDLYQLVTDTTTAGAFHDEAKSEREAADRWRRVTIGAAIATVLFAVAVIVVSTVADLSSTALIVKGATATLALGAIAAYAGRESEHHRTRGNQAKDLALELATAEGFLHGLEPGETRELRKGYFERAFRGRADSAATKGTKDEAATLGLTPELVNALLAVLKAGKAGKD